MADVTLSYSIAVKKRAGATPVSLPNADGVNDSPINPSGPPPGHPPVTIATPANGLSISGQELSLGLSSASTIGALSSTDWSTFNAKIGGTGTTNRVAKFTASGTIA